MSAITASALVQLNDCTPGLLHLTPNGITLGTLLSLGQLLHLGLQQGVRVNEESSWQESTVFKRFYTYL